MVDGARRSSGEVQLASPEASFALSELHKSQSAPSDTQQFVPLQGVLVKDGETTRYINEALLSQVLEKVTDSTIKVSPSHDGTDFCSRKANFNRQ